MTEPQITILAIPVNDQSLRLWARPYLVKFGKQFGIDTNHIDPRNRVLFSDHEDDKDKWPDQLLDDGLRLWMLTVDEVPARYVFVLPESTFYLHCMHIRELFIDPKYRRKGYAKQLLDHAIAEMRKINPSTKRVSLSVLDRNQGARKLYTREGFVPHAISMIKEL